jgi:DUF1365 family protein
MLDLDELDAAFAGRWWWSAKRPAPMRFRRRDYFGDPTRPLAECVRDAVAAATGSRPDGPVRVLTNLRSFGFVFNPVIYYCCHDRNGTARRGAGARSPTRPGANGTTTSCRDRRRRARCALVREAFHVSPFQPMEQRYDWTLTRPGEQLVVHMENVVENQAGGQPVFDATLRCSGGRGPRGTSRAPGCATR